MTIGANDIVINITPNPIKGTVGKDIVVDIIFTNSSTIDTAYNLYSKLIIPDGLEFKSASEQVDSSNLTSNYSQEQIWFNIQNIGPGQTYTLKVVLQGLINYRNPNKGKVIFNRPIDGVNVNAIIDTMLRGNQDKGNVKISKTFQVNFIPLPYSLEITAPSKMPKGAGQLQPTIVQPQWKYNYIIKIDNGSVKQTNTSLTFRLNNGIRYLSISSVTGPDIAQFDNVTIVNPSSEADYTLLIWNNLNLNEESIYEITIEVAIWNKYTLNGIENFGTIIPHGTLISSIGTLTGTEGQVQNFAYVKAMYFTIDKKVANNITNVNTKNQYTLTYDVNQYTGITEGGDTETFQIIDTIGDGQTYNSDANVTASDVISNNNETIILWDIPSIFPTDGGNAGVSKTITYTTTTKVDYKSGDKIKSFDMLSNNVVINALTTDTSEYINDTSEESVSIIIPTVNKELLKYYYADSTEKASLIGAPGDFAQFKITYDATTINAEQDNIIIRDFFPSSFSNVILDVSYGGSFSMPVGVVPEVIEPNGVQWQLGNIPANQDWSVIFKVPVISVSNIINEKSYNVAVDMGQNNVNEYFNKRSYVNVNIGEPNISFNKTVKGLQVDNIKPGEIYTYTITVNNNQDSLINVTDAFEMTLVDTIPKGLSYKAGSATVKGTGDYGLPSVSGQTLTLDINKLEPNQNLILIYDVIVNNDVPLGATLKNTATLSVPYSQPDKSYQYPGEPLIATTTLKTATILYFTKVVSPPSTKIGDIVTYILDIRVPKGTIVSNVQIKDTFPDTNQEFITGSITKDGVLIEPQPIPIGGVLTFPEVPNIDASDATTVLIYSFSTRVIDAAVNDNFVDMQVNNAVLNWIDATTGVIGAPINTSINLYVNIPSLQILKSQSNITKNIDYTSEPISFQGGDILSYRINVINEGTAISYNNVITDMISNYFNVDKNSIVTSNGDVVFQGNILKWNIEQIRPNEIVTLIFNLNVSNQLPNTLAIENITSGIYESNNNEFRKNYGPVKSNTVISNLLNMRLTKTASLNQIEIGDTIKYTLTLNVIEGTILYDVSIYDLLPSSQEYVVGSATKQIGVEPPVQVTPTITTEPGGGSNRITFPQPIVGTNNNIEAFNKDVEIQYAFDAVIQQGLDISPYWQDQTNVAYVKWDSIGDGSGSQEKEATTTITVNVPKVNIYKAQKNFTQYGTSGYFTKGNIIANRNDIIYYQIKVESDGASPGYNINIEDILDNKVEFIGTIQAPTIGNVTLPTLNNPLQWNIPTLTENTTATYIFSVKVNDSLVIGTEINNSISGTYSSTTNGGKDYNLIASSVKAIVGGIKVIKTSNVSEVDLGNEIQYNIEIIIPKNSTVHDLIVTDNLDIGQQYINNSWTSSLGVAATPTIINNGNTLIYEETTNPITSPADSDLTINYTLKAKITSSSNLSPYEQEQINTCNVTWANTAGGTKVDPIVVNVKVMVRRPNLEPLKLLRNVTKGQTDFTYVPEQTVTAGDVMEYKLSLTNTGMATAYNTVVRDVIGFNTSFVDEGNPNVYPIANGIGWNPGKPILPGQTEELIIKVNVLPSYKPGEYVQNVFVANYNSGTIYPISMPSIISNFVYYISSRIDIKQYFIKNEKQEENTVALAGEIIGYKIVITIPKGVIANNLTVTENLNPGQEYIPNSLKSIGGQTPIPKDTPTLIFPNEGTIDATTETKVIIYTFNVKVKKTSSNPTESQYTYVLITWDIPGVGQSANSYDNTLTVSSPIDIKISSAIDHKNIKLNDSVLYTLTITNASSTEVYNANITENLPTGFVLKEISSIQYNSLMIIKDAIEGATNFNIVIPTLLANSTCTIEFYAIAVGPIVPGGDLINSANISYSLTPNTLTQIYGPVKFSDAITFDDTIEFTKSSSVMDAQLGDIIMYHLNAEIPQGIMIYGAEIEDVLPDGQMYTGEATLNGKPIYIHENGQELMSNKIPVVYAKDDKINLHYIINARVVEVMNTPPFLEVKQNDAWFRWYTDPSYVTSKEVTANSNVIVRATTLDLVKLQRNKTQNTMFNYIDMNVNVGDLIEYKLVIQNLGDTAIYNIVTEDILENFTTFTSVIDSTIGSVTFDNSTNQLTWTIDILQAKSIAILIFECKVLSGAIVGASKTNVAMTRFTTSIDDPTVKGPIQSEVLTHNYPLLSMELISGKYYYMVGDIVTYNIIIKVPKGMDFYNLSVEDILPVEQTFISSTLNETEIIPQVEGQLIKFPIIDAINLKNEKGLKRFIDHEMIYNYEIKARIDGVKDPNGSADIQMDSVSMTWSLDPANTQVQDPISKTVEISVVDNLISVQKWQKLDDRGKFTTKELDVNNRDIIQYKIVATNIGTVKAYNMSIEDILDNGLEYINIVSITNGTVEIKRIDNNNVLIWNNISELDPNEVVELIFSVRVISLSIGKITNKVTPMYSITPTSDMFVGVPSNIVILNTLGKGYNFIPEKNNYIFDNEAISYGVKGCSGKIGYILTNTFKSIRSYTLHIDPIPFQYELFIDNKFIEEIPSNVSYDGAPLLLQYVSYNSKNIIELRYSIPEGYNLVNNEVDFNVIINLLLDNAPTTIKSRIVLGEVKLSASYNISGYSDDLKLFLQQYDIQVNISKGIKIYDLELQAFYPPSYIFQAAYINGVTIEVINGNVQITSPYSLKSKNVAINLNGRIIYPIIEEVDSTENEVLIKYSFELLQYKKIPLKVGALAGNKVILSLRTSPNIENKCYFVNNLYQLQQEELICVYVNKLFGKCVQYYSYKNIAIPIINGYVFNKVVFHNPEIIKESLIIRSSTCDKEFSEVKYEFTIPYTIIYQGCGCLSSEECSTLTVTETNGVLEKQNLNIVIYMPNNNEKIYDIISEVIVKNIVINKNHTEFCVCIGVVTSSIAKKMITINELGKCELLYCCPNCNTANNTK